jgi:hypothetical protein
MLVTTQLSEDSCDWDCNSGMIAKTDLGTEGTQSSSLNTGGMCHRRCSESLDCSNRFV